MWHDFNQRLLTVACLDEDGEAVPLFFFLFRTYIFVPGVTGVFYCTCSLSSSSSGKHYKCQKTEMTESSSNHSNRQLIDPQRFDYGGGAGSSQRLKSFE